MKTAPLRFLVFGDSGSCQPEQVALAARMTEESADLVLHTGDLGYPAGSVEDLKAGYLDVYGRMMARTPFFACPGNHDYGTDDAKPFLALQSTPASGVAEPDRGRYYSFDRGPVHFIALDSNRPLMDAVENGGRMLRWLEEDLRKHAGAFWKIVFFHHPPYAGGPNGNDVMTQLARRHITPILERHGVQLVLNGHEHSYQRSHPVGGAVYVTTGGAGAGLYPVHPMPQVAAGRSVHHYLRVEIGGWGLKLEAVDGNGSVVDEVNLAPPPALASGGVISAVGDPKRMAPGSIVSLFGRTLALEGAADEVDLLVDGQAAKLLYCSPSQINAVLPENLGAEVNPTAANSQWRDLHEVVSLNRRAGNPGGGASGWPTGHRGSARPGRWTSSSARGRVGSGEEPHSGGSIRSERTGFVGCYRHPAARRLSRGDYAARAEDWEAYGRTPCRRCDGYQCRDLRD